MGLLGNAYYMTKMVQTYLPSIKDIGNKLMDKYVSSIDAETWSDKVSDVDVSGLSYPEQQENVQIAMQMAELASGQCDNLAEAISTDPVQWGQYLQDKGIDTDKLDELQTQVEENGEIPPYELLKLTLGSGSSTEQQAQAEQSGVSAEAPAAEAAANDSKMQMLAESGFDDIAQTTPETTPTFNFEDSL